MSTITIDQLLDIINQLPFEQQEILIDISHKRLLEKRRQNIAQDAQSSLTAFHKGDLIMQSADQIIQELHDSLDEDDA